VIIVDAAPAERERAGLPPWRLADGLRAEQIEVVPVAPPAPTA
jgi:hypothetical protein